MKVYFPGEYIRGCHHRTVSQSIRGETKFLHLIPFLLAVKASRYCLSLSPARARHVSIHSPPSSLSLSTNDHKDIWGTLKLFYLKWYNGKSDSSKTERKTMKNNFVWWFLFSTQINQMENDETLVELNENKAYYEDEPAPPPHRCDLFYAN